MKFLIVVDMQNDFITGALGSKHAEAIVPRVAKKVQEFDGKVIFTMDTHGENYLETQEGKNLPVAHCIKGTRGWQICDELLPFAETVIEKPTFGSTALPELILSFGEEIEEIELCGLCTDICVISNAMLIKASLTETKVVVDASGCAGVSVESHKNALEAMKMCQIAVING